MAYPEWLIRPIAHRGLHDAAAGVIENTRSAFEAAIAAGYAIELDLQEARDGEPVVFHDATLDRLTEASGPLIERDAAELCRVRLKGTQDRMQTLPELLQQVAGRVPLIIEVKSRWDARGPFETRIGRILADYGGPAAVMSFDPASVAVFRDRHPRLPRGLVATRFRKDRDWQHLGAARRCALTHLLYAPLVKAQFIAYDVRRLPALAPLIARKLAHLPLLTWTVRTEEERATAERWADAMIFERLRP